VDLPTSRHFTLHELSEGVYAGIANDGAWAICNAGIVNLGDRVIVFDTFVNQQAASDLKAAAEQLAGRHVDLVVNSHYHSDHVKGNQAFAGATVVSTSKTRDRMIQSKRRYETELENIRKDVQADLEKWVATPDDPDSVLFEGYDRGHLEGLPTLRYTLPNATFDSVMAFHGTKRRAEAVTFGGGHTISDALLYLPDDRIAFLGDLLFVQCHPYLGDGDLGALFRTLDKVEALEAKVLVPGHGPLGTPRDVGLMRQYVDDLQKVAEEVWSVGGGLTGAINKPIGPAYENWKWRAFRKDNLEFLLQTGAKT
jgi:glyoxylase-like metal-dependent hydrolase (beta-lactamase superfamily II)